VADSGSSLNCSSTTGLEHGMERICVEADGLDDYDGIVIP
jgi:hypothetical protein